MRCRTATSGNVSAVGVIVAAYTVAASLSEDEVHRLIRGIREIPGADGYEIPVLDVPVWRDTNYWASPESGSGHILTAVPALNALAVEHAAGLAAKDEDARRRAIDLVRDQARWVATVNGARPGSIALVSLIAGPSPADADLDALRRSFDEVAAMDWSGARPVLEHCDALRPGQPAAKGFLELADELTVLPAQLGLTINWGRSAIEGHSAAYVSEQIASVSDRLTALMFSGAAAQDTPLGGGPWADEHVPMRELADVDPALAFAELSLLGASEIEVALAAAQPDVVGVKIKLPASLPVDTRLAALRRAVELVAR